MSEVHAKKCAALEADIGAKRQELSGLYQRLALGDPSSNSEIVPSTLRANRPAVPQDNVQLEEEYQKLMKEMVELKGMVQQVHCALGRESDGGVQQQPTPPPQPPRLAVVEGLLARESVLEEGSADVKAEEHNQHCHGPAAAGSNSSSPGPRSSHQPARAESSAVLSQRVNLLETYLQSLQDQLARRSEETRESLETLVYDVVEDILGEHGRGDCAMGYVPTVEPSAGDEGEEMRSDEHNVKEEEPNDDQIAEGARRLEDAHRVPSSMPPPIVDDSLNVPTRMAELESEIRGGSNEIREMRGVMEDWESRLWNAQTRHDELEVLHVEEEERWAQVRASISAISLQSLSAD